METGQLKLTQTGTLIHNEDCIIQNTHERGKNNLCVIPLHGINKDLSILRYVLSHFMSKQTKENGVRTEKVLRLHYNGSRKL